MHQNIQSFLDGFGVWVIETLEELEQEDADELSCLHASVGHLLVEAGEGLVHLFTIQKGNDTNLPLALPYELAKIDMQGFVKSIQEQQPRLQQKLSDKEIDVLSQQFGALLRAYQKELFLQQAILCTQNECKGFSEIWVVSSGQLPLVQQLCGGLASAFPNTASVKLDFSVINWGKDENHQDLTDFLLEGIMHCKQHQHLKALSTLILE